MPFEIVRVDAVVNSTNQLKEKIEKQKEKHGWEFIFLGASIDAGLVLVSPRIV